VDTVETPGVYYPILKALAWAGINFIEIISVSSELTIIFRDKDVDRAFSVIKGLIGNSTSNA
jgi:aspartokinase